MKKLLFCLVLAAVIPVQARNTDMREKVTIVIDRVPPGISTTETYYINSNSFWNRFWRRIFKHFP
jgi:hypothetical protein